MSVVVPSQVVQYIDTSVSIFIPPPPKRLELVPPVCGALNALLRLIEKLPNYLLPSGPRAYAQFVQSQESIRFAVDKARTQDAQTDFRMGVPSLAADRDGKHHVEIIRDALAACPDEVAPSQSHELPFIDPPQYREALLIDLEAARSALSHVEWKAATVLAGSLVEALLLWAIQKSPDADIRRACADAVSAGRLNKMPEPDPLWWGLHEFTEVAEQLRLLESGTAIQVRLGKEFRNLIHAGRAIRTQRTCDRGTALAANAAVEFVSRDLAARFH